MEGLKRTCVAKALAVFAVASVTTGSFAQTTETTQSVIKGVEDFVGLKPDQVKAAAVDADTISFEDKTKVLFFYNVQTGKFLNVGGYWGTSAALHDYGKAMLVKVNGSYLRFVVDNSNDTGNNLGYVYGSTDEKDNGVFVDRGSSADKVSYKIDWTIEPITGDAKNTVKIYTTISDGSSSFDELGNYYLSATPGNNGCGAYKTPTEGYDKWRIFTYDQIYEAQRGSVDNMTNALDLSFRLRCPSFERNDNDIKYWKTYNFVSKDKNEVGFAKFGLEKYYSTCANWSDKSKKTNLLLATPSTIRSSASLKPTSANFPSTSAAASLASAA